MARIELDAKGLKCPQPILKIQTKTRELKPGDTLRITADCDTFDKDLDIWQKKSGKTVLYCRKEGTIFTAEIQF